MPHIVAASRPKSLYSPVVSTLLTGLVSYWPLGEGSGTRYDVVGTNHLTDNNTVTSAAGKIGAAAVFAAANSEFLSVGNNSSIQCGDVDFTISAWVNLGSKTSTQQIISKINSGGGKVEYDLSWVGTPTNRYRFSLAKPTDNWVSVEATIGNIDLDTWHLIVVWHDHTQDRVYIQIDNGTVESAATGGALQAASTADLYFGYRQWVGQYLTGLIDEVGFWKRVLTTDERSSLWNGGAGITYPFSNGPYFPISILTPMAYTTFQRDGSGEADIPITGTYGEFPAPGSIEARWNGGAWTVIDAAPTGNTFSGTLTGQSQGQGTLQVRFTSDNRIVASQPYIGIGDVFVVAGQSNASGYATNNQVYSHALKATMFAKDYLWHDLIDPTHTNANYVDAITNDTEAAEKGSIWPLLATAIMTHENVPVAFVPCAKGSTGLLDGIAYWPAGVDHLDRTTLYGAMNYRAQHAQGIKALLWWEGESEINTSRTEAEYHAALVALATNVFDDLGVKVMPCKIQDCTGFSETAVNAAIGDAWTNHSDVILTGPDLHGLTTNDTWHLISDINQQAAADLWWAALHVAFYGG